MSVAVREYSYIKRALLRELSENSRASITYLARKLKCSRNTVAANMQMLEEQFGVKYTLQLNKENLGLLQNQIWLLKFESKPKAEQLREFLLSEPYVEFAAVTKGDYDLVALRKVPGNIVAGYGYKYAHWGIKIGTKFERHFPAVEASFVTNRLNGFTPLPTQTLELLCINNLQISELDKRILVLLNQNARYSYQQLANTLKRDVGVIKYRVNKLIKSRVIERPTIIMTKPPMAYHYIFSMDFKIAPGINQMLRKAQQYYINVDGNLPVVNKFQYLALTTGKHMFFGIGSFDSAEQATKHIVSDHMKLYEYDDRYGAEIKYARVLQTLKGHLPIRNIDFWKDFKVINNWNEEGSLG